MNKLVLAIAFCIYGIHSQAQISHGGAPLNWPNETHLEDVSFITTEQLDYDLLASQDAVTDQYKEVPYRFGYEHEVSYSFENTGRWILDTDANLAIWQLGIECPGALSISLLFSEFQIPKGGKLFIWSADRTEYIGSFTHLNNNKNGQLATGLVHGDKVVVEYIIPMDSEEMGQITIGQIVHGYRSFLNSKMVQEAYQQRGPFGNSDNCHVNVNCPEAVDWQIEKRAVAIICEGGFGLCTGAMVNNTANDGTPYFLTANHCTQGANEANWVFYFNHEATNCNGSTGPTNQSISGGSVVANNAGSDFALLLLNDTPPASFNVQYAGWDATDDESAVQSAVCIHHPSGDVKKISWENDAPYHSVGNSAQVWWIDNWEVGVTEPGSSGSPLFNQDHRIIGQLFGGASACNGTSGNGQYDFYGRFGVSWDTGTLASTRLRDWLDPGNTGTLVLDGYPEGAQTYALDAAATSVGNVPASLCSSTVNPTFTLTNHGSNLLTSCTIHFQLNSAAAQTINWSGSLAQNESENVNLPQLTASNGNNTLTVWITNPNGSSDENAGNDQVVYSFNAVTVSATTITLDIQFDEYPDETSWEIVQGNNVLYTGGLYTSATPSSSISLDFCLPNGCYDFTIFDDYGDGICCQYGDGSYQITNSSNTILLSGSEFTTSETTNFCLGVQTVEDKSQASVNIYPNPANAQITINSTEMIGTLDILDVSGRTISTYQPNKATFTLSTNQFSDGVYYARITGASTTKVTSFIVKH
jgi:lysyl endopeptidase